MHRSADDHLADRELSIAMLLPGDLIAPDHRAAPTPFEARQAQFNLSVIQLADGDPEAALEMLAPLHRRKPRRREVQWAILAALFATQRSEDDFPWVRMPVVLRLDPVILKRCYKQLRRKRRPKPIADLYAHLHRFGYPAFSDAQLATALEDDERFLVTEHRGCSSCRLVSIRRHRE